MIEKNDIVVRSDANIVEMSVITESILATVFAFIQETILTQARPLRKSQAKLMYSSQDNKALCIFYCFVESISSLGGNKTMIFVLILITTRYVLYFASDLPPTAEIIQNENGINDDSFFGSLLICCRNKAKSNSSFIFYNSLCKS